MGGKSTKVIFQRYSHGYRAEAVRVSVPWSMLVENLPNHFPRSFWKHLPEGFEPCYYRNDDDPLNLSDYFGMSLEEAFKVEGFNDSIHPLTFSVRFLPIPRQQPIQVQNLPLASIRSPFKRSEQKLAAQLREPKQGRPTLVHLRISMLDDSLSGGDSQLSHPTLASSTATNESYDRPAKDDEQACAICMDNVVQVCIVPCGHRAFCITCAEKLDICSICMGRIELRQRVFDP